MEIIIKIITIKIIIICIVLISKRKNYNNKQEESQWIQRLLKFQKKNSKNKLGIQWKIVKLNYKK